MVKFSREIALIVKVHTVNFNELDSQNFSILLFHVEGVIFLTSRPPTTFGHVSERSLKTCLPPPPMPVYNTAVIKLQVTFGQCRMLSISSKNFMNNLSFHHKLRALKYFDTAGKFKRAFSYFSLLLCLISSLTRNFPYCTKTLCLSRHRNVCCT